MFKRIADWFLSVRQWAGLGHAARLFDDELNAPIVPALLADVPGGQANLLPVSALVRPLRVEVPMWPLSQPDRGEEVLQLFWNDVVIFEKRWTVAVLPQDLLFDVPVPFLLEGHPVLRYEVKIYNQQLGASAPLTLTIDSTMPVLAVPDDRLQFDGQVVAGGVTVAYLENNGDQLLAEVPVYATPTVGDRIFYYWDRQQGAEELVDERVLAVGDLGKPLQLVFTGDLIRQRGDGQRYVHYRITDRAGNQSRASGVLALAVAATPPARILSWPELPKASGTGETVVLDLGLLRGELEANIPANAGVGSQEPVEMQWGEPGMIGAATIVGSPGTRTFAIPHERLAAHSGKTIALYYRATGDESTRRLVSVLTYKPFAPPPQVAEADTGTLSLADVVSAAHITQDVWALVSTDQRVRIIVLGGGAEYRVADAHAVTQAEIDAGLLGGEGTLTVPKTFLQGLAVGTRLLVQVSVSLDGGASWPASADFELQLTLVA